MNDWISEAHSEIAELQRMKRDNTKIFHHQPGSSPRMDGDGVTRALAIARACEDIARKARGMVATG